MRHSAKIPAVPVVKGAPEHPQDWSVLRTLWPYLTEFPARVILALTCLVLAKGSGWCCRCCGGAEGSSGGVRGGGVAAGGAE